MAKPDRCVLCSITPDSEWDVGEIYNCETCGSYKISTEAFKLYFKYVTSGIGFGDRTQANLRHWVHRRSTLMNDPESKILPIDEDLVRKAWELPLPDAVTLVTRLVEFTGSKQKGFVGKYINFSEEKMCLLSVLGVSDMADVDYVIRTAVGQDFVKMISASKYQLTALGWAKYHDDKIHVKDTKKVFMAMPYNKPGINKIYEDCFIAAVAATGFELFKVDDEPKAGSINNKMIVDIRNSRFLIADLTYQNPGAYWEAGFAEGLGIPVIYTCEKSYWDKNTGTHFDTKSFQTVIWESGSNGHKQAAEDLKNVIRATLPTEAIMED